MGMIPINRVTLFKHGIAYVERSSKFSGTSFSLSYAPFAVDDLLKSLTIIDKKGKISGIEYPTPLIQDSQKGQDRVTINSSSAFRDLVRTYQGYEASVEYQDASGTSASTCQGRIIGIDEDQNPSLRQGISRNEDVLVTILEANTGAVRNFSVNDITSVTILDERGMQNLVYFLDLSSQKENERQMTIHLLEGDHDLSISYIIPAPAWRVSYRLLCEIGHTAEDSGEKAHLIGWGIFDNTFEEDLESIRLSLVAGYPVSFKYDLSNPRIPERPTIQDQAATTEMAALLEPPGALEDTRAFALGAGFAPAPAPQSLRVMKEAVADSIVVETSTSEAGGHFEFTISNPVSVKRGQSAMVPIISAPLSVKGELLFDGRKQVEHPTAVLRLENDTNLTLERGPVTILDKASYAGEAIIPFLGKGSKATIVYALEKKIKVTRNTMNRVEKRKLEVRDGILLSEEWDIFQTTYKLSNNSGDEMAVKVEHPARPNYALFDPPADYEERDNCYTFEVRVSGQVDAQLTIKERFLRKHQEKLSRLSFSAMKSLIETNLFDGKMQDDLARLIRLLEDKDIIERDLQQIDAEKQDIFQRQQQVRDNLRPLKDSGDEGILRSRFVQKLAQIEDELEAVQMREQDLSIELKDLIKLIDQAYENLGKN